MNVKQWIATAPLAVAGALALAAAPAQADNQRYARQGAVYDYAQVIDVDPIVRIVTVTTPERECWEEMREYPVNRYRPAGNAGGTLVGAIIGGVIGHQFGSGRGNDAATAAGALIGAAVGSNRSSDADGHVRETYARPVQRCRTNYAAREEERIDGYRVTYRYNGQKYATTMPYDPGERLRIRVDVRPAE